MPGPYFANCWRIGYFEVMYFLRQNRRSCIVVTNGTTNRHCSRNNVALIVSFSAIIAKCLAFCASTWSLRTHTKRQLEQGLRASLRDFLLEMGVGFAFVVSQHRRGFGGNDFWFFTI